MSVIEVKYDEIPEDIKLVIFDADHTLRVTKSGGICPNKLGDQKLLPFVSEAIMHLDGKGIDLGIATNQGGVACGYITELRAWDLMRELLNMLPVDIEHVKQSFYIDKDVEYTQFYPFDNRKPKPTMLEHIMIEAGKKPEETLFVGDGYSDKECAENARSRFCWSHHFFGWDSSLVAHNKFGYQYKG